jgi:hypothetical protein
MLQWYIQWGLGTKEPEIAFFIVVLDGGTLWHL